MSDVYEYDGLTVNRIADKPFPAVGNRIFRKFQIARNFYSEYKEKRKSELGKLVKHDPRFVRAEELYHALIESI